MNLSARWSNGQINFNPHKSHVMQATQISRWPTGEMRFSIFWASFCLDKINQFGRDCFIEVKAGDLRPINPYRGFVFVYFSPSQTFAMCFAQLRYCSRRQRNSSVKPHTAEMQSDILSGRTECSKWIEIELLKPHYLTCVIQWSNPIAPKVEWTMHWHCYLWIDVRLDWKPFWRTTWTERRFSGWKDWLVLFRWASFMKLAAQCGKNVGSRPRNAPIVCYLNWPR